MEQEQVGQVVSSSHITDDELPIPPGLLLKPHERKKKNEQLILKAEKRLQQRGAPNFGAHEGEILEHRITIEALKNSNNKLVEAVKQLQDKCRSTDESLKRAFSTFYAQEQFFADKYPDYKDKIEGHAETKQFNEIGLIDKENATVEVGDTVLMRFKVLDGETIVDDKTQDLMAYQIGSQVLSCEYEMVGMKVGERRILDVVFKAFPQPEYAGKLLKIDVVVEQIKTKKNEKNV